MPATIVSFDTSDCSASVQPSINKNYFDGTTEQLPVIHKVPVVFPVSGLASFTFPINAGDFCLLLFSERSLEEWKRLGINEKPIDRRKFALSDAIAIPGLIPFGSQMPALNNEDLVIKYGDSEIRITQAGEIQINSGTEVTNITSTGDINISASGTLTASGAAGAELKSSGTAKLNGTLVAMGNSLTGVELIQQIQLIIDALVTANTLLITALPAGSPAWTALNATLTTVIKPALTSIQGTI
jgi:hypothetical protein